MKCYQYFRMEKNTVGFTSTFYIDSSHQEILDIITNQLKESLPGAKITERTNSVLRGVVLEKVTGKEAAIMRGILLYLLDTGWQPVNLANSDSGPFILQLESDSPEPPRELKFSL